MMSRVSGLARGGAARNHVAGEREESVAARAREATAIQRTLGNRIAGLLAELSPPEALGGAAAQAAARRGLIGGGQELPHLTAIQRSFGRHDVRGVSAHSGAAAQAAARALGAAAYTSGEQVAFAEAPDLRTAAHEAAHVIQQRAGIELPGGIDRPGDRFEQHADAVAERVVAGQSAEPLLDAIAGSTAGRRAAAEAPVQRRLTVKASALRATRYSHELKQLGGKMDLLARIIEVLEEYEQVKDPAGELARVNQLRALLELWERPTRTRKRSRARRRAELLGQLEAEVVREREQITWQTQYMSPDRPFAFLGLGAQKHAFDAAHVLTTDAYGDVDHNTGAKSKKLVKENDLSAAEVAALRVFSLDNYKYINPAIANDRAWMQRNFPDADEHEVTERMQEGSAHAAVMLDALAKMPPWSGVAYRGERLTDVMFSARYIDATSFKFPSFASLTVDRSVAEKFSKGDQHTPDDATTSVVVRLNVRHARNISKLSAYRKEKEVLLLPGAEFAVVKRERQKHGKTGNPPATRWFEVELDQVR